jgi:heavy metal translocating P-type ATPase
MTREAADDRPALLSLGERFTLALRLSLAMIAAGLLGIALIWRATMPGEESVADLIAGAAAALVAVPVFSAAWSSLRNPGLHGISDQLVALALLGCWAAGDLMTAAVLPIVMIVGHVLEERSLIGSREAIGALGRLVQNSSVRIVADGERETVLTQRLRIGDRIALQAGDRVPVDGVIREGHASIDVASLTGESVPVDAGPGDTVLAGSMNLDGVLELEVVRVGADTTLGRIIALMHEAEAAKPPVTRLLEAYAGHYIALVLLVAAGVWFATSDTAAMLAVLVASCPCALVLAAPATAVAAIVVAARHGILIKGSAFLEQLAEVSSLVLDKTGTVTTGALTLAGVRPAADVTTEEILALAASLGAASSHPVSRALANAAPMNSRITLTGTREERGLGMRAHDGAASVAMGRPALLARLGAHPERVPEHDGPVVGVCRANRFLGWLLLADQPRPEAAVALEQLRGLGLHRQLLVTGDRAAVAARVGRSLGIDEICSEMLPEQKMQRVMDEVRQGYRPMVVGDGINDSLALRAGAVGVAMGAQGTDVALASADLVLMTSDLRRLGTCIRLSRRCRRTLPVNVALGLGWTVTLIVLAACGLLGPQGAIVAAVVHNFSTLLGIANSGRLLRFDETSGAEAPRATTVVPLIGAAVTEAAK